uniref:Type I site-specific deoxyribonuclease n=1 Tax=Globodera pallida TaxID=36090 RepID=A0A183C200_GLOPA
MVEVNLPTWKLPYFVYLNDKKEFEQENAFENFKFIHSLSEYSLTIYEIIKMANILGEINDELLEKAEAKNNFPDDEAVKLALNFFVEKQKLCDDKPKEEEIRKHFRDNMLQYANVIEVQIDPHKELQQIIPPIIDELEEMLQNGDWNYVNLQTMKKVEWTLLEFDLERLEQIADWNKIDKLRDEWCKMYNEWFKMKWVKKDEDVPDFAKLMEKMKEKLKKIEEIVSLVQV